MGSLERFQRQSVGNLPDSDHDSKCRDHDRMPVILDPDTYDLWLDPGMRDVRVMSEMLKPYDARQMRCYPVNTRINYVMNDDEACSAPVELAQTPNLLF